MLPPACSGSPKPHGELFHRADSTLSVRNRSPWYGDDCHPPPAPRSRDLVHRPLAQGRHFHRDLHPAASVGHRYSPAASATAAIKPRRSPPSFPSRSRRHARTAPRPEVDRGFFSGLRALASAQYSARRRLPPTRRHHLADISSSACTRAAHPPFGAHPGTPTSPAGSAAPTRASTSPCIALHAPASPSTAPLPPNLDLPSAPLSVAAAVCHRGDRLATASPPTHLAFLPDSARRVDASAIPPTLTKRLSPDRPPRWLTEAKTRTPSPPRAHASRARRRVSITHIGTLSPKQKNHASPTHPGSAELKPGLAALS
jgi:hypothetical protein